jgi:hypothetical protein
VTVFVNELAYGLVTFQAPFWYINADLKVILSDRTSHDSVAAASPLSYAPDPLNVITSLTPPSPEWFETLPMINSKKVWAIYAVKVVKEGYPDAVYIGSGTNAHLGSAHRVAIYHNDYPNNPALPRHVRGAFKEG